MSVNIIVEVIYMNNEFEIRREFKMPKEYEPFLTIALWQFLIQMIHLRFNLKNV
jgi:hypothetical protein